LADAVQAARREAEAAFGDATVYAERFVRRGRHVEIQVVGDSAGTVLHLLERECSLQRRHQKILEESPAPGAHPDVLARMYAAAVAAAQAVDYTSLGTVEFLLDDPDPAGVPGSDPHAEFFFLEMNTRLQVEHPVTELITGLDLVETQLRLATGEPLTLVQDDVTRHGHAVEVRLVAENPAAGWVPSSGRLLRFDPPDVPGVRWDSGVATGSTVPAYYDSLIAKVIAHGSTRPQALDRLRSALSGLRVHGVATNREALLAMVDDADVRAGRTTIDLLEARADSFIGSPVADLLDRHAVLAALAARADRETRRPSRLLAPAAWRSMTDAVEVMHLSGEVSRAVTLRTGRTGGTTANVDDAPPVDVRTHSWDGERLDVELDGVRRQARVLLGEERDEAERAVHVFADGHASTWTEPARLPAGEGSESARGPSSPVPGTVLAVAIMLAFIRLDQTAGTALASGLLALILAYVIRFVRVAWGPLDGVAERIRPEYSEVARSLGVPRWYRLWRVNLPLLGPGLLTAFLLALVEIAKEMPATLMLRPFGWDTLAIRIYELTAEGQWQAAAIPSLVLVALGAIPVFLLIRRARVVR